MTLGSRSLPSHHDEHEAEGGLLLGIIGLGLLEGDALADLAVGLEAEAEDGDEDQGEDDGKAEDLHLGAEGVGERGQAGALIGGVHQAAEDDAERGGREVAAGERAAVDGDGAGELVHPGLLADGHGDGGEESEDGEVGRAHDGQDDRHEEQREGEHAGELAAGVEQAAGEFFQRAVEGREVVEQRDRDDDEHGARRPHADDVLRLEADGEAADEVGEDNAEETGVDLGLVAKEDGEHDRRDNQNTEHENPPV